MPLTSQRQLQISTGKIYFDRLSSHERSQINELAKKLEATSVAIGLGVPGTDGKQSLSLVYSRGTERKGKYRMSQITGDIVDSSGTKPADA